MTDRKLRLGVAGLGRGFMLMLPTLARHPKLELAAAADPRPEARAQFARDFGGPAYATVAELCADPSLDAIYVATPHGLHLEHVTLAARAGKHVLVEKPMALSVADCQAMIDVARAAGVQMLVGHSHSFDLPYLRTRALIESLRFGRVRMITALNYTDFLYRPRRPEELDTGQGGGVVFSQAAHQVDIVRLLGGGRVRSVRAAAARDETRGTEGAYSALLTFEDGAFATMTYSGSAHFDSDEFQDWVGELGQRRDKARYGEARTRLRAFSSPEEEARAKNERAYGSAVASAAAGNADPAAHNHFGLVLVSCDRADLRPMSDGVRIYADDAQSLDPLPKPDVPRAEVIDELYEAIMHGVPPIHSGEWGLATMEVCLALLQSAAQGREVTMAHQCGVGTTLPSSPSRAR
ncbi:MAG TPA: Gfo/Idh/MocA family oxidoreductase [Acetobacteraceae bacterium]|nr:Gfo/Idh/MocA family oxidoreductase [Acetobacteraceae bacterium]